MNGYTQQNRYIFNLQTPCNSLVDTDGQIAKLSSWNCSWTGGASVGVVFQGNKRCWNPRTPWHRVNSVSEWVGKICENESSAVHVGILSFLTSAHLKIWPPPCLSFASTVMSDVCFLEYILFVQIYRIAHLKVRTANKLLRWNTSGELCKVWVSTLSKSKLTVAEKIRFRIVLSVVSGFVLAGWDRVPALGFWILCCYVLVNWHCVKTGPTGLAGCDPNLLCHSSGEHYKRML